MQINRPILMSGGKHVFSQHHVGLQQYFKLKEVRFELIKSE